MTMVHDVIWSEWSHMKLPWDNQGCPCNFFDVKEMLKWSKKQYWNRGNRLQGMLSFRLITIARRSTHAPLGPSLDHWSWFMKYTIHKKVVWPCSASVSQMSRSRECRKKLRWRSASYLFHETRGKWNRLLRLMTIEIKYYMALHEHICNYGYD